MARSKSEKMSDVAPSTEGVFSINSVLKTLRKKYPDSTVDTLQQCGTLSGVTIPWFLSTGLLNLDWVCGKGIPGGRLIEIYSHSPSEGKTSILSAIIKSAQKNGFAVLLMDGENGTLRPRMIELGIDPENLIFESPDTLEAAFNLVETAIIAIRESDPNIPILIAYDSICQTPTLAELEASYEDRTVGAQARVLSSSFKKLTQILRKNNATMVFTNQAREKIAFGTKGDTRDSVGGLAGKFFSHIRLGLRRIGFVKGPNNTVAGIEVQISCKKNKVAQPFRKTVIVIRSDTGIDPVEAEFVFACEQGILKEVTKGWYSLAGEAKKWRKADFVENMTAEYQEALQAVLDGSSSSSSTSADVIDDEPSIDDDL